MISINRIEQCYRTLCKEGRTIVRLFDGNPQAHGFQYPPEVLAESYQQYFETGIYAPDPKGFLPARETIAQYYAEENRQLSPDNIILTPGTSESFFYLFSILTNSGDNILMPNPAYPLFDHIADYAHISLRQYPLNREKGWAIDLEQLEKKIDGKTKAIVVVSPNNPTGAVISAAEWTGLCTIARKYNLAIIYDEVFREFLYTPSPLVEEGCPLLFTLNGISKMFALPSLKLGWIAVAGDPKQVAPAVDQLETMADTFLSTHTPIQTALPCIFEKGKTFLKEYKAEVAKRRNLAVQLLQQSKNISFVPPQGGFYLTANVKTQKKISEEDWVIELMKAAGVFVHPGYFYDFEQGINFVFSFLAKPAVLKSALEKIRDFS